MPTTPNSDDSNHHPLIIAIRNLLVGAFSTEPTPIQESEVPTPPNSDNSVTPIDED